MGGLMLGGCRCNKDASSTNASQPFPDLTSKRGTPIVLDEPIPAPPQTPPRWAPAPPDERLPRSPHEGPALIERMIDTMRAKAGPDVPELLQAFSARWTAQVGGVTLRGRLVVRSPDAIQLAWDRPERAVTWVGGVCTLTHQGVRLPCTSTEADRMRTQLAYRMALALAPLRTSQFTLERAGVIEEDAQKRAFVRVAAPSLATRLTILLDAEGGGAATLRPDAGFPGLDVGGQWQIDPPHRDGAGLSFAMKVAPRAANAATVLRETLDDMTPLDAAAAARVFDGIAPDAMTVTISQPVRVSESSWTCVERAYSGELGDAARAGADAARISEKAGLLRFEWVESDLPRGAQAHGSYAMRFPVATPADRAPDGVIEIAAKRVVAQSSVLAVFSDFPRLADQFLSRVESLGWKPSGAPRAVLVRRCADVQTPCAVLLRVDLEGTP